MANHKINIKKNTLSWEKIHAKKCDKEDCENIGEFKAPKSRVLLNEYFYFCLTACKGSKYSKKLSEPSCFEKPDLKLERSFFEM